MPVESQKQTDFSLNLTFGSCGLGWVKCTAIESQNSVTNSGGGGGVGNDEDNEYLKTDSGLYGGNPTLHLHISHNLKNLASQLHEISCNIHARSYKVQPCSLIP